MDLYRLCDSYEVTETLASIDISVAIRDVFKNFEVGLVRKRAICKT